MKSWLTFQKDRLSPTQHSRKQQLQRARRGTKSCQNPRAARLDRNQDQRSPEPSCDLVPNTSVEATRKRHMTSMGYFPLRNVSSICGGNWTSVYLGIPLATEIGGFPNHPAISW